MSELIERALALVPRELYIDGSWRPATGGGTYAVTNPATGETITEVADATPEDGIAALAASADAQHAWARTPARVRSGLLRATFERLIGLADEFGALMTLEMGKPFTEARGEVAYGAEFFRWFAEEAVRINGRYSPSPEGTLRMLTLKRPVGPMLAITPWNFPLAMATRKLGPALAAGCTTMLKPSHLTPLTAHALIGVMAEVGFPAGVVNLVGTAHAQPMTGPMIADRRLRKISFTGSTPVGMALMGEAARNVVHTSMELGGCAPFIVFADADLDRAVEAAQITKLRNLGEACNAANTFYVQREVADEFSARLAARFASLTVDDGFVEGTDIGPIVSEQQRSQIDALVQDAVAAGARVLVGGSAPDRPGYFYQPTVLANVPAAAAILREEIFGPVAPVTTFDTEDEVLALANASDVGLAGYVHTGDLARALRMTELLEVGMIGINSATISNPAAPFGGVKHSGLGREGGSEGIDDYLDTIYVGFPDPFTP